MPNAERTERGDGKARLVVDESSFDFRGLSSSQIEQCLDDFNDAIRMLRRDGLAVACAPMWEAVECLDGCELYQFLCREYSSEVDRDTLVLSHTLLSRCPEWDDRAIPRVGTSIAIGGEEPTMALSVAFALAMAFERYGVACVVFPDSTRSGYLPVRSEYGDGEVFFFHDPVALPIFWRRLFAFEDVPSHAFFDVARLAFPDLVFHHGLSFNRFEGAYSELRERVVTVLAVLNDRFIDEYRRCKGQPSKIKAAIGHDHVDVSPESPNTRGSQKLMRQREVTHEGEMIRCEWHAKLERHRNRIHFSTPSEHVGGKILVGIFVSHLDT